MTQYSSYKRLTNIPWYSPPFCIRAGGRKFCIRVDANGCCDGAGTHVSVHVLEMSGDFYDKWIETSLHYKKDIKIQLVNHRNEQDLHVGNVCFTTNSDEKQCLARTKLGCGISQFISHTDLESSTETSLFIMNDCLTWRIHY